MILVTLISKMRLTRDIDKLDELSLNIKDLKKCVGKSDDFKKWDYPEFEEYY